MVRDQVTGHLGSPGRVLCVGVLANGAASTLESVLFGEIKRSVSMSLIEPGLTPIRGLPRAAWPMSTRRLRGTASPPATHQGG